MKESQNIDLHTILTAEPEIRLNKHTNETQISVTLPGDCFCRGSVIDFGKGNIWLFAEMASVPEQYQTNGIGEKLARHFYDQCKRWGARNVYLEVWSEGGLRLTAKMIGKENLTFYNPLTRERLEYMNYDLALTMGDNVRLGVSARLE